MQPTQGSADWRPPEVRDLPVPVGSGPCQLVTQDFPLTLLGMPSPVHNGLRPHLYKVYRYRFVKAERVPLLLTWTGATLLPQHPDFGVHPEEIPVGAFFKGGQHMLGAVCVIGPTTYYIQTTKLWVDDVEHRDSLPPVIRTVTVRQRMRFPDAHEPFIFNRFEWHEATSQLSVQFTVKQREDGADKVVRLFLREKDGRLYWSDDHAK